MVDGGLVRVVDDELACGGVIGSGVPSATPAGADEPAGDPVEVPVGLGRVVSDGSGSVVVGSADGGTDGVGTTVVRDGRARVRCTGRSAGEAAGADCSATGGAGTRVGSGVVTSDAPGTATGGGLAAPGGAAPCAMTVIPPRAPTVRIAAAAAELVRLNQLARRMTSSTAGSVTPAESSSSSLRNSAVI
ncbi:hypothetical protein PA7_33570 [Pseudonocardia asaccharolytica DSM 44247 = NBRC 16224]|uniref:Uncharacterized protein n=1 Tax=Pseudonocardia asaccharolytica DSM 44247 = NBRC 16224 TaxID=1123024 RepID=A0A511D414_9PSEU|nr:hypothetical protein PA7_33570 [Pseudonocardia asaccharolytica DSM 44247 = NBRC 16224]